jgi:hypothetical protein
MKQKPLSPFLSMCQSPYFFWWMNVLAVLVWDAVAADEL